MGLLLVRFKDTFMGNNCFTLFLSRSSHLYDQIKPWQRLNKENPPSDLLLGVPATSWMSCSLASSFPRCQNNFQFRHHFNQPIFFLLLLSELIWHCLLSQYIFHSLFQIFYSAVHLLPINTHTSVCSGNPPMQPTSDPSPSVIQHVPEESSERFHLPARLHQHQHRDPVGNPCHFLGL